MRTFSIVCSFMIVVGAAANSPAAESQKAEYPKMPEAFSSFGAAVLGDHVYVYGGHIAPTHTYSTEAVTGKFRRLDLKNPGKGWEELPGGPGLQGLALVAHGSKLYRIGGMQPRNAPGEKADNISVATVAVFDPKARSWSPFIDLPAGRSSHDATVVGDTLVVVGGWHMKGRGESSEFHDGTLLLDLASDRPTWRSVPQPFRRRALNSAAIGSKVYAVGGMNSDNDIEKRVDVFDLKSGTWSQAPELPGPTRNGFTPAACAVGGTLVASPYDGKVYRLGGDAWVEIGELDARRLVHRIVPVGSDRILVLGGTSKMGNLDSVESISADGTRE